MTSDLDIYRTASVLIREHGEDAALEAAQRADAMLEEGYLDGQRVWKRVLAAVKAIQRQEPRGSAALGPAGEHDVNAGHRRVVLRSLPAGKRATTG
jgi:hypothetical protein